MSNAVSAINDAGNAVHNSQNNFTGGIAKTVGLGTGAGNVGQGSNPDVTNTTHVGDEGIGIGVPQVRQQPTISNPDAGVMQSAGGAMPYGGAMPGYNGNAAESAFRQAYMKSLSPNTNFDINGLSSPSKSASVGAMSTPAK